MTGPACRGAEHVVAPEVDADVQAAGGEDEVAHLQGRRGTAEPGAPTAPPGWRAPRPARSQAAAVIPQS